MEVILATAFGRSIDVQGGAGGRIVEAAYEIFSALSPGADDRPQPFIVALQLLSSQSRYSVTIKQHSYFAYLISYYLSPGPHECIHKMLNKSIILKPSKRFLWGLDHKAQGQTSEHQVVYN